MPTTAGKRRTTRKLGYVADFCPICREISEFKLTRIGLSGHFCGITFMKGRLTGHEATCQTCGITIPADGTAYDAYAKKPGASVEFLIQETHLSVHEIHAARLEQEDRVRTGSLTPAEMDREMLGIFRLFSPAVAALFSETGKISRTSGACLLATLVIVTCLIVAGKTMDLTPGTTEVMTGAGVTVTLAGTITALLLVRREPKAKLAQKVLPLLARGLLPLRPNEEDIVFSLHAAAGEDPVLARIPPQQLWEAVRGMAALEPAVSTEPRIRPSR